MSIYLKLSFLFLLLFSANILAREARDQPNIVVYFLDDSGYGDFSHNGNPTISTPNISKLASDGINFTQFYVTSPACSASRYSLLTGRYPGRSGMASWVIGPTSKYHLHPKETTIAEGLKAIGYKTGIFGKWHLGTPNEKNHYSKYSLPLAHGFDTWIGTNISHDYNDAMLIEKDPKGQAPISGYRVLAKNLPSKPKVSASLTGLYTEKAVDFIDKNKARPFFAYIALNMPHLGLFASDRFIGRSRRGLLGDVMSEVDESIGQIRTALKNAGIEKNTLIIFSSDNGPWIRFQNTDKHHKYGEARLNIGYAQPFRDGKGSTWEGGHRVPGIFYWPGQIPAYIVEQAPVSTLDILPTVFQLTGVQIDYKGSIDGRDISPYLFRKGGPVSPFQFLYSYEDNQPSAIREGPWKLHVRIGSQTGNNYGFTASRKQPLLFQVEQDFSERFDRASEKKKLSEDMLNKLEKMEIQINEEGSFWRTL
jgi:arylsulfatase